MAKRNPVTDLKNYDSVLRHVAVGSPVYLTVDGQNKYAIRDIREDEELEKTKAMLRLMCEINKGKQSGEEDGYTPVDDVKAYFDAKRR